MMAAGAEVSGLRSLKLMKRLAVNMRVNERERERFREIKRKGVKNSKDWRYRERES